MKPPAQDSSLAHNLARAEAIKAGMMQLLRELESKAAGRPVDTPGGWRHHPVEWAKQHLPEKPTI